MIDSLTQELFFASTTGVVFCGFWLSLKVFMAANILAKAGIYPSIHGKIVSHH